MQMRVAIRVTFLCAQKQGTLRPGTIGGEPARIQFTLPIVFRLS